MTKTKSKQKLNDDFDDRPPFPQHLANEHVWVHNSIFDGAMAVMRKLEYNPMVCVISWVNVPSPSYMYAVFDLRTEESPTPLVNSYSPDLQAILDIAADYKAFVMLSDKRFSQEVARYSNHPGTWAITLDRD